MKLSKPGRRGDDFIIMGDLVITGDDFIIMGGGDD